MTAHAIPIDVATRARNALNRFKEALENDPRLRNNPDAIANIVNAVRPYIGAFPQHDVDAIVTALRGLTGRDMMWVRKLLTLSEMDVRRALRSKPPNLDRHGYETIYPADGWLGAYLLYAQDSEAPLGWHFWCAVATLGLVARRNFYWDRGKYILYLNHYLMLVGPTGLKKSTTIDQSMSALKLAVAKAIDAPPHGNAPDPIMFSASQVSFAAFDQDLDAWYKAHPDTKDTICALVNDEVVTLFGKNVFGSDLMIGNLTKWYMGMDEEPMSNIKRGKRLLKNLQISCLFGTAPDWIRESVTTEMLTGGFLGRCVMVPRSEPHGIYPEPPPSDPVVKHALAEALVPWLAIEGLVECRRTPEATAWYWEWYHTHKGKKPVDPKMEGWWNRKDDHLHKLAAVLRLSELVGSGAGSFQTVQDAHTLDVDITTFQKAAAILSEEEERLPKLIAMVGASRDAQDNEKLLALIEQHYNARRQPIPHTIAMQKSQHFLGTAWHFDRAMETLRQSGKVRVVNPGLGKRRRGRTYMPTWADDRGEDVDDEPETPK